ncbi:hypothetical protein GCM10023257_11270 [Streptomyces hyderabadensis]|uniref:Uncharacterized protein n=1 Tax=Streptomyces hyderabadensis TaxID=598549 RepID=A0ABP9HR46_9ACTN
MEDERGRPAWVLRSPRQRRSGALPAVTGSGSHLLPPPSGPAVTQVAASTVRRLLEDAGDPEPAQRLPCLRGCTADEEADLGLVGGDAGTHEGAAAGVGEVA